MELNYVRLGNCCRCIVIQKTLGRETAMKLKQRTIRTKEDRENFNAKVKELCPVDDHLVEQICALVRHGLTSINNFAAHVSADRQNLNHEGLFKSFLDNKAKTLLAAESSTPSPNTPLQECDNSSQLTGPSIVPTTRSYAQEEVSNGTCEDSRSSVSECPQTKPSSITRMKVDYLVLPSSDNPQPATSRDVDMIDSRRINPPQPARNQKFDFSVLQPDNRGLEVLRMLGMRRSRHPRTVSARSDKNLVEKFLLKRSQVLQEELGCLQQQRKFLLYSILSSLRPEQITKLLS